MATLVYSTSTGGFTTPVRGDRAFVKADAMARGLALGFSREQIEWALKRFRSV